MYRKLMSRLEGDIESYLGVSIVDGSRSFDASERETIKKVLSATPRPHLKTIRAIRAEASPEPWLGRYRPRRRSIELNVGWDERTLVHEIGHALHHALSGSEDYE